MASVVEVQRGFSETRDFRMATLGNVDAGKSTLVGCLVRNQLDDGRGLARSYVLRHQHEQKRGQSSSVSMQLVGFREGEQVVPTSMAGGGTKNHNKDFFEVATKATHRLQLVDLCGHQKYLKSSIYGLTAMAPDAALVVIGAERGIQRMTREHVGLVCALRIPFLIVMTKIDMAPPEVLRESQQALKRLLNRAGRKAFMVRESGDIAGALKLMERNQTAFAPVFEVSCVQGTNMDNLRDFISQLTTSKASVVVEEKECEDEGAAADGSKKIIMTPVAGTDSSEDQVPRLSSDQPLQILVDDSFSPPGIGVIIGGTVIKGMCEVGQKLYVGPTKSGEWMHLAVKGIHRQCVPSKAAYPGQHGTFAIKALNSKLVLRRDMFRKGMYAVDEASIDMAKKHTIYEFEALTRVLHHATTIEKGYSPFIHVQGVRQSARILELRDIKTGESTTARTGSEVIIRFRFLYYPVFAEIGSSLIFREGESKGCGKIIAIFDQAGTSK